jgi:competence protein ComEA
MKKVRLAIRQYFDFSEKEVNGFIVLIFLMVILLIAPFILERIIPSAHADSANDAKILDSMMAVMESEKPESNFKKAVLFSFDPNTSTKEEFVKLGLRDYLAERIIKFKSKGGKFKTKSDLKKIYGFPETLYDELEPYISLPDSAAKPKTGNGYQRTYDQKSETKKYPKFDINTADSNKLEKVYGIGFKTATRIIKYRDKLGGFISMDQLYEIWKLDSAVIYELQNKALVTPGFAPLKISINKAEFEELKNHPYIGYKLAKVIVSYRQQHGDFHMADQLKEIKIITEDEIKKLEPYLAF